MRVRASRPETTDEKNLGDIFRETLRVEHFDRAEKGIWRIDTKVSKDYKRLYRVMQSYPKGAFRWLKMHLLWKKLRRSFV